jgi:hypothetical protein
MTLWDAFHVRRTACFARGEQKNLDKMRGIRYKRNSHPRS